MANKFELTKRTVDDLAEIWNYTYDTWSESQADKYYHLLLNQCQEIADGRIIGKSYTEISDDLYGSVAGQHIIFYRVIDKSTVEITRILHNRMDLRHKFGE
jgi:toxin ParE1/3/4